MAITTETIEHIRIDIGNFESINTDKMESEEKLNINWLNSRHQFDKRARNDQLLSQAMLYLTQFTSPIVVDLGSGTGNNTLNLIDYLPLNCELVLVEQHAHLLEQSRQRILVANQHTHNHNFCFIHQNLHQWLNKESNYNMLCTNALFDLFTTSELNNFLHQIESHCRAVYSTLNYEGICFFPNDPLDTVYISQFEKHMCRQLDRGKPLGPAVFNKVSAFVSNSSTLSLHSAISYWEIDSATPDFMKMNFEFYRRGIEPYLDSPAAHRQFDTWLNNKRLQLEQSSLRLQVKHRDFLILPLKPC